MYEFPVHDCTQENNGSQMFDDANGRRRQERLLRSRNFLLCKRDVTLLFIPMATTLPLKNTY